LTLVAHGRQSEYIIVSENFEKVENSLPKW